ncbi:MAG TPA: aminotransferase class I/II-fold pyridoxal phosphate-dependent enzyme [Thermoanaerobaculia bacterium]|nr:aminotransferase class I/II-fold pyridoxal phosphate-dependent enzyme [Thermoanaerobaculia bacterium]
MSGVFSTKAAAGAPRVLIVGGAGYLGVPCSELLLERGYRVRVFDRMAFGRGPVEHLTANPAFELIEGDLRRLDDFPHLLEGIDAVVHLAALSDERSCELDPAETSVVNVTGTARLADRCLAAGTPRFLFASSCGVYARRDGEPLLTEEAPTAPVGRYAQSKAAGERALIDRAADTRCLVILRLGTLYGVSPRMRFDLVVNRMTLDAVRLGRIRVDHGDVWRPLLHVRDAARGFLAALEAPAEKVHGEIFNLGSESLNSRILEIAESVGRLLPGTEIEYFNGSSPSSAAASYRASFEKIRRRLGFEPALDLVDGIREVARRCTDEPLPEPDSPRYVNVRRYEELRSLPAIEGGDPALPTPLPFALPSIGVEEEAAVLETLRSGWLTAGPKTRRFEELFAERVGARHAVATNSCTAALHLALVALGVTRDDEVVTSPVTFPATANVVLHQGARPVFVDVEEATLNLDVARIEGRITSRTRVILPVHLAGNPCRMDEIHELAARRGLRVVEDAAHAVGARYREHPVGSLSDATCFSFYPIKNMTAIEGGMVTTDDAALAARIRLLSLHGVTHDAWSRHGPGGELHWETVAAGYKYNMTDVQAAVGLCQLDKLDGFLARRASLAKRYREALGELAEIRLLDETPGASTAHHLCIVVLELERLRVDRDDFVRALRAENVGTGIHFRSLHLHPFFRRELDLAREDLPVAARASDRILSLPLYPRMTDDDQERVVRALRKVVAHYRR